MINWHIRNQVLRKLVKLANSQNVNQYDYINVYGTPYTLCGVFFVSLAIDSLDTSKLEILLNDVCSMQSLSDNFLFLFISF